MEREGIRAALAEGLEADMQGIGGQKQLVIDLNVNPSTPSRWGSEATMPLWVWVSLLVLKGASKTLHIIAALAGYKLVRAESRESWTERVQGAIHALLNILPASGAA